MLLLALLCSDPAILSPQPWQVVQQTFTAAQLDAPTPRSLGSATVQLLLSGTSLLNPSTQAEYRVLPTAAPGAQEKPANPANPANPADTPQNWLPLNLHQTTPPDPTRAAAAITLNAGGWYRLEIRILTHPDSPAKSLAVEPVGAGEVFLIAGQSYATNTNDERLQVRDRLRRVSAYNWETGGWQPADDPQPAPDRSDGGSIWPPVGDRLAQTLNVPIGFVNVAVGGTSTRQWSPDGPLSERLHRAGQSIGRFRAVLWQQGESDVIEGTSTEDYIARLQAIRAAAVSAWQFEPVWLCALSTHHPTVYHNPAGEGRIRSAIAAISQMPGFGPGPDTDSLTGDNRGGPGSRRHFSPSGQRNAAQLWSDVLLAHLLTSTRPTP